MGLNQLHFLLKEKKHFPLLFNRGIEKDLKSFANTLWTYALLIISRKSLSDFHSHKHVWEDIKFLVLQTFE